MRAYRGRWITRDDDGTRARAYYFPWGTNRIPHGSVGGTRRVATAVHHGRGRIWGTSNLGHWASLDPQRPSKSAIGRAPAAPGGRRACRGAAAVSATPGQGPAAPGTESRAGGERFDAGMTARVTRAARPCEDSSKRGVACPQRDSNPCYRLERAASWAARRWGRGPVRGTPAHATSVVRSCVRSGPSRRSSLHPAQPPPAPRRRPASPCRRPPATDRPPFRGCGGSARGNTAPRR